MIELKDDALVFSFPEVHADARMRVAFQRTLRIPDDDAEYPLPPGLGRFPLRHVDDYERVPRRWRRHGGVMLPMYQSEALWLEFERGWGGSNGRYPFAVKIAAGKIDAVTGEAWKDGLGRDPQDYVVVPEQPWLDGYAVEKGVIRQFVAMPLGAGYTAEEQLTGTAEHGGIQIIAYPMKAAEWERIQRERERQRAREAAVMKEALAWRPVSADMDMGLAPGGRMRQEIYDDPYGYDVWDTGHASRCFVHIANSLVWRAITGDEPPTTPPTSEAYTRAGLPWFDYYDDGLAALEGGEKLKRLRSILEMAAEKGDAPLPENEGVVPGRVVPVGPGRRRVREGAW